MKLEVNGEPREVPEGRTVRDLLGLLDLGDGRGVAVAVDGEVVPRSEWDAAQLRDGQRVEVVRAVQGGQVD